jgi:hypothetical protein
MDGDRGTPGQLPGLRPGAAKPSGRAPGLVKQGRATLLAGRQHDFFRFEPPGADHRGADFVLALAVTAPQQVEWHADPPVRLADLRVDDATNLNGDDRITGSVHYECRGPVPGKKRRACGSR